MPARLKRPLKRRHFSKDVKENTFFEHLARALKKFTLREVNFFNVLELEVDERAAVCAHELVNDEDDECRRNDHERNRLRRKCDAVAALELFRNPVDEHARDKHEDDVDVFPGDGAERVPFPGGTHLLHHVLGGVPGDFVCFGGVEV